MEEYGLTPDELIAKDFRVIQNAWRSKASGRTARFSPHGRREWITAIKKVYKRDPNITTKQLQTKSPHLYYQGVWIFGDWDKALRAAEFDPERMRIRRTWDEEAIIRGIRQLRAQRMPLYAQYAMKNRAGLFHKAIQDYGSWGKALVAAGVVEKAVSGQLHSSPLAVLRALRDFLERRSKKDVPQALKSQAEYYLGSLPKAMISLKKDQRLSRGWSKRTIIKILRRLHRSKKPLTYSIVRREAPALASAAERIFGSWGKALYAAGIDPNLYFVHHRWRKAA